MCTLVGGVKEKKEKEEKEEGKEGRGAIVCSLKTLYKMGGGFRGC